MAKSIEEIGDTETPEQLKLAATNSFLEKLQLDSNDDGELVAVIVNFLAKTYPDDWLVKLDEIMMEAYTKSGKSIQDAMFYLGDIVAMIGKKAYKKDFADDPKGFKEMKRTNEGLLALLRTDWDPQKRSIAGIVSNDIIPDWWVEYEMGEGRYDESMNAYLSGTSKSIKDILANSDY